MRTVERLSYFSMYPADYLLDTVDLSLAEHGAYTTLMFRYYWDGSIQEKDKYRACRTAEERASVDAIIARFFHVENGVLKHHRIEREMVKLAAFVEHQSKAGRASAEARRGRPKPQRLNGAKHQILGFDAFYAAYPLHKGRAKAEKAWQSIAPDEALCERIMQAVKAQTASAEWKRENGKFIPHPTSWLNGKRWEDEVTVAAIPDRYNPSKAQM